jgi:hypothetical protein
VALDVRSLPVDLVSFTAHKLCGPKGIGALYVAPPAQRLLRPVSFGGRQERGLRPGTLPTHQIAGFGLACEMARQELPQAQARLGGLSERLWAGLESLGDVYLNCAEAARVPGVLNVSFGGVDGESLITGLPGLAVSTGAACNSETREPSYVLRALGRNSRLAESSLRFSMGRFSTAADIEFAIRAVRQQVTRLRALSPELPHGAGSRSGWPAGEVSATGRTVTGEAGGPDKGTWVRFHLQVAGDSVKEARFQALGCPHTMDTVAWLCEQLPGRTRDTLIPGAPAAWAAARSVPVEKLGRLLIVEDALLGCLAHWA